MKKVTNCVTNAHRKDFLFRSGQLVSSTLATSWARAKSRAASTGAARASLTVCSDSLTTPRDMLTRNTSARSSWALRLDSR
jgi:hypothetical protein